MEKKHVLKTDNRYSNPDTIDHRTFCRVL